MGFQCSLIQWCVALKILEDYQEREPQAILHNDKLHVITVEEKEYENNSIVYFVDYDYWKNNKSNKKIYSMVKVFSKNI